MEKEVTLRGVFSMQVCVPQELPDEEVVKFANLENPSGTEFGWSIRREGDPLLGGDPERQVCDRKKGFVHIVLDK